jgi:glycerol uptake facilitator-like aquaporin
VERCQYSCGFMNPSVVIASHVIAGDVASREAVEAIGAYVVGGFAACAVVAIAAKILTPEPPSAKRARQTSKAAIRSISRAREKKEKEMARSASKSKKL